MLAFIKKMRQPIEIGDKHFKYKKDALLHYKEILNSYDFGEILNKNDTIDVVALLKYEKDKDKIGVGVKKIRIGKVQYGTKCFEIVRNDLTTEFFSYVFCINGGRKPITKFRNACRNAIHDDLNNVKQEYFDQHSVKGKVKCQETGILSLWTELNVDHRQPNTFSVIIDRFIELNNIDLKGIAYEKGDDNLGRSHQGRIRVQKKDLRIEIKNKS